MKILLRPDQGDVVLYHPPGKGMELFVVEEAWASTVVNGRIITSVQFLDGTWGLVETPFLEESRWGNGKVPFRAWVSDNHQAEKALREARWIISHQSLGGEVYHVFIENWEFRRAAIKLFYGKKQERRKKNGGLHDEIFWETDRDMKKRLKNP